MIKTELMDPNACFLNREKFAVTLRKQKKAEIIHLRRLKFDHSQRPNSYLPNSTLTNLCLEIRKAINEEDDVLPALTQLRILMSNENFIDQCQPEIQINEVLVETIMELAREVELNYMDLGLLIEEFTWLMINVAYLCSHNQVLQLAPTVNLLCKCYRLQPDHVLQSLVNFIYQQKEFFETVIESNLFDSIVQFSEIQERQGNLSVESVIQRFRIFSCCSLASDNEDHLLKIIGFERLVQIQVERLFNCQEWRDVFPDYINIIQNWTRDLCLMSQKSEKGAKHVCDYIDINLCFNLLTKLKDTDYHVQNKILLLLTSLAEVGHKDFLLQLSKYKVIEYLACCTENYCQKEVYFNVTQLLNQLLQTSEFETRYSSLRRNLINCTPLITSLIAQLSDDENSQKVALETLYFLLDYKRVSLEILMPLICIFNVLEHVQNCIKLDCSTELILSGLTLVSQIMSQAKMHEDFYERVYQSFEMSGCLDHIEALQNHTNSEIFKWAYQIIIENSPEGVVEVNSDKKQPTEVYRFII